MKEKVLIVEDLFVEADYLRMMLTRSGYTVIGIAHSVTQAQAILQREKPDFVLLDIFLKGRLTGIDLGRQLAEDDIPFIYLSAYSNEEILRKAKATQPHGFLVKPFREKDLLITMEIAHYRHIHGYGAKIMRENMLNEKLTTIADSDAPWEKKLRDVCIALQPFIPYHYVTAGLDRIRDESSPAAVFIRIGFEEYQQMGIPGLCTITGLSAKELIRLSQNASPKDQPTIYSSQTFDRLTIHQPLNKILSDLYQTQSLLSLPLKFSNDPHPASPPGLFLLSFGSRQPDTWQQDHLSFLDRMQKTLTATIEKIINKNSPANAAGTASNNGRDQSNPAAPGLCGIIGKSPALLHVFDLITSVAGVDTSVLILGESGTGKERVADCIHQLSDRKDKPFVKVNCAALPESLIESELFGHEKGAFTGAHEKRIGKFEKADKGTIFLDEIGEMPADLQVKLLRVLQEKYIERVGSGEPTKVDVRVIAATNRNLEKEVAEGRFRLDLYYRLNVFPIPLPPLRERTEDIPDLAHHFMQYYNRKTRKKITGFSEKVLRNMSLFQWPGNIRELENLVERSVLLAKNTVIEDIAIPSHQKKDGAHNQQGLMKTIAENERDYIITVLIKCKGKIWGAGGAAEVLGIPPTTLTSKMKKLGINKRSQ